MTMSCEAEKNVTAKDKTATLYKLILVVIVQEKISKISRILGIIVANPSDLGQRLHIDQTKEPIEI